MTHPRRLKVAGVLAVVLMGVMHADAVRAEDLLSSLFGAFTHRPVRIPALSMPPSYGNATGGVYVYTAPPARPGGASRVAYCVRSCDGRYFPVPPGDDSESAASTCNSFCPAAATKVVYGSSIDSAVTSSGESYSDLPNAFRYRKELVADCSCNGRDTVGLAQVKIEDDHTLRKGDIVAGPNGLLVANGRADSGKTANFTPAPASIRRKFARVPVVASE